MIFEIEPYSFLKSSTLRTICYHTVMFCDFVNLSEKKFEHRNHVVLNTLADFATSYVATKKKLYHTLHKTAYPAEKVNFFLYDGGGGTHKVVRKAMSGHAMALIYGIHTTEVSRLRHIIDNIWLQHPLCQAVRNRLRMVSEAIATDILAYPKDEELRIVSVACGFAPAVLENIVREKKNGRRVIALLVDQSQDSIDAVLSEVRRLHIDDSIETMTADIFNDADDVWEKIRAFKPHIGEAVGILDYLDYPTSIRLGVNMRNALVSNGMYVTTNIMPNRWQHFLRVVVNWHDMQYRTIAQLDEIMSESGFMSGTIFVEPWHMFQIAVGKTS